VKPSLGRVVLARVNPAENNGSDVAPAIITRVWSDVLVNVRVLLDGEGILWRTSVALCADEESARRPAAGGHAVYWPPLTFQTP